MEYEIRNTRNSDLLLRKKFVPSFDIWGAREIGKLMKGSVDNWDCFVIYILNITDMTSVNGSNAVSLKSYIFWINNTKNVSSKKKQSRKQLKSMWNMLGNMPSNRTMSAGVTAIKKTFLLQLQTTAASVGWLFNLLENFPSLQASVSRIPFDGKAPRGREHHVRAFNSQAFAWILKNTNVVAATLFHTKTLHLYVCLSIWFYPLASYNSYGI